LEFIRTIFIIKGLAEIHLKWSLAQFGKTIRRRVVLIMFFVLIPMFLLQILPAQERDFFSDNLGRLLFLIQLLVPAMLLFRLFSPNGLAFSHLAKQHPNSFLIKIRYALFFLFILMPIGLGVATLMGYFYTAQQLYLRTVFSISFLIGMTLLHSLLLKAILAHHQVISAAHEAQEASGNPPASLSSTPSAVHQVRVGPESNDINIFHLGHQARRLLLTFSAIFSLIGLWYIWVDILPAIRILNQIHLWSTTVQETETISDANGVLKKVLVDRVANISLMHLILAISGVFLTISGSKTLPGLLDISLFKRFQIDSGERFALRTLTSYFITILGLLVSFQIIGMGWEKVQWLAAAVSVGLGFGLQEIFANFISGLIILFERPLRVGDVITVSDITGTVTKIQIRATTIMDWDRKELIVPNKEFITGKVVNWTLSDTILRVVFKIGAAYGTDPDLVRKTLLEVAHANPKIMKNPAPVALFANYGDSAIQFELRVFIPNMDDYSDFQHSINTSIDRAFQQKGIQIPFPQVDIRMVEPESAPKRKDKSAPR